MTGLECLDLVDRVIDDTGRLQAEADTATGTYGGEHEWEAKLLLDSALAYLRTAKKHIEQWSAE